MVLLELLLQNGMRTRRAAKRRGSYRTVLRKKGELTPSLGVLYGVREHITIPVYPIIHPRGGVFYYTGREFATMLEDRYLLCHRIGLS